MPRRLTECGSVPCLKALVAGSDSLSMLPASAIDAEVRDGRIRPARHRGAAAEPRHRGDLPRAVPAEWRHARSGRGGITAAGLAVGDGLILAERSPRASQASRLMARHCRRWIATGRAGLITGA
jgi:hypothetical protein